MTTHDTTTVRTATAWTTRFIEVMERGDLDDFREITHPDAENDEAVNEPLACRGRGPEPAYATALWLRSMFSDLRWEIHEAVGERDLVVAYTTMTGRHTGPYERYGPDGELVLNRPATGLPFETRQTHWFRLAEGRYLGHWANRDDLGMATQLGFLGAPPAVG